MPGRPANCPNDEPSEGDPNAAVDTEIVAAGAGEGCDRVHHRADIGRYGGRDATRDLAVSSPLAIDGGQDWKQRRSDLGRRDGASRTNEVVLGGHVDERGVRTGPEPEWIPELSPHAPGQAVELLSVDNHRDQDIAGFGISFH